jgi:hypothetical protein
MQDCRAAYPANVKVAFKGAGLIGNDVIVFLWGGLFNNDEVLNYAIVFTSFEETMRSLSVNDRRPNWACCQACSRLMLSSKPDGDTKLQRRCYSRGAKCLEQLYLILMFFSDSSA